MFELRRIAVLAAWLVASTAYGDESWHQFGGPQRDNISPDTGLLQSWDTPPKLLWKARLENGLAGLSIRDGILCTLVETGDDLGMVALDANTGKKLWRTKLRETPKRFFMPRSTPTIDGDLVFAVMPEGAIVCLETAAGKLVWRREFTEWGGRNPMHGYCESPLVDGDQVVCTPYGVDAGIVALNKKDGKEIWRCPINIKGKPLADGTECYVSMVLSNGGGVRQYVQVFHSGVASVDSKTGKQLWSHERPIHEYKSIPSPIAKGDYIFATNGHGAQSSILKLSPDGDSGVKVEEVFFSEPGMMYNFGAVIVGDHLYTQEYKGATCKEFLTGKKLDWKAPDAFQGDGMSTVVYADGNLYYHFANSTVALVAANPNEFQLKGQFRTAKRPDERTTYTAPADMATPTISGGRLYIREMGIVYCYDLKSSAQADAKTEAPSAQTDAMELVKQLGAEDYYTRERASVSLLLVGPKAVSALEKAQASSDYEVRDRVEKLLAKLRDMTPEQHALEIELNKFLRAETGTETSLPGWKAYKDLVGDSRESRRLFWEMQKGAAPLLAAYEKGDSSLSKLLAEHIKSSVPPAVDNNFFYNPPYWVGSVATILFTAADKKITLTAEEITELFNILKSDYFPMCAKADPVLQKLVQNWLTSPNESIASAPVQDKMQVAVGTGCEELGVALAASVLEALPLEERNKVENFNDWVLIQAMAIVAQNNNPANLPLLESFLGNKNKIGEKTQFRDVVLSLLVQGTGEDLKEYGMEPMPNFPIPGGWLRISMFSGQKGFPDDETRENAYKKWSEVSAKLKQSAKK